MLKRLFFLFVLLSFALFASSLEDDIALFKNAPKEQRYLIMNKIKIRLSKMNAKQRASAMQRLFNSIHPKRNNQTTHKFQKTHKMKQKYHKDFQESHSTKENKFKKQRWRNEQKHNKGKSK